MIRGVFDFGAEAETLAESTPNITRTAQAIYLALAPGEGTPVPPDEISTAVAGTLEALEDVTPGTSETAISGTPAETMILMSSGTPVVVTLTASSTIVTYSSAGTETPVSTDLPTTLPGEPTRTPSRTSSPTSIPANTATHTPTHTATYTPTMTFTPVPPTVTHTPNVCLSIDFQPAGRNGQEYDIRVLNDTGGNIKVEVINLSWPASNEELKKVELDGSELWSGEDDPNSANLSSLGGNRTIPNGSNETMVFFFDSDATSNGYTLRLTFDNGCVVEEDF
jgi:hypothetical protein